MAYTQDDYRRAEEILERRRERANIEADSRRAEINLAIPELAEITQGLAQVGLNISKVFLFSENKQADMERLQQESLALQQRRAALLAQHGYDEDALEVGSGEVSWNVTARLTSLFTLLMVTELTAP